MSLSLAFVYSSRQIVGSSYHDYYNLDTGSRSTASTYFCDDVAQRLTSKSKAKLDIHLSVVKCWATLPVDEVKELEKFFHRYLDKRLGEGDHWFNLSSGRWKARPAKSDIIHDGYHLLSTNEILLTGSILVLQINEVPSRLALALAGLRSGDGSALLHLPSKTSVVKSEPKPKVISGDVVKSVKSRSWETIRKLAWADEPVKMARYGHLTPHNGKAQCYVCLTEVTIDAFEAGHLTPRAHLGQDTIENLRVSCVACNRGSGGMHDMHAYEYILLKNSPGLALLPVSDPMLIAVALLHEMTTTLARVPGVNPEYVKEMGPTSAPRKRLNYVTLAMEELLGIR